MRRLYLLSITLLAAQSALFACATAQDQSTLNSGGDTGSSDGGTVNSSSGSGGTSTSSFGGSNTVPTAGGPSGGSSGASSGGTGPTTFGGSSGVPNAGSGGSSGAGGSSSGGTVATGGGSGASGSGTGGSSVGGAAGTSSAGSGGGVSTCGAATTLCTAGQACKGNTDCASGQCVAKKCAPDTCKNGMTDGDETDKDCGGSCAPCALGASCKVTADCTTKNCTAMVCGMATNCLIGWEGDTKCDTCSMQTQGDLAACKLVLQCYEDNSCNPTTCGQNSSTPCGQNAIAMGTGAFPIAADVYNCRCPAGM